MGKAGEEQPLPSREVIHDLEQNVQPRCASRCTGLHRFVRFKCILFLLLSAAVFLSAIFWLPPFLQFADHGDSGPGSRYKGHDIVASFIVQKPASMLEDSIWRLADDIFDEIGVPSTKVVILSLESLSSANMTKVVFAFDPDGKYSKISPAAVSLIRASFEYLVTRQLNLKLTASLFGDPTFFEVLKFRGGITIIPQQSGFPLQPVQILFNFTLNFSIYQLQVNFKELTRQLKSGLLLASYENLYVSLSNSVGSTVSPPTIVQSSVLLAVGNTPSRKRLKQLAQTITRSDSRNLGLNNTVFGRVKQVRLSSIMQHSLHGSDGSGTAWSPSPAPTPQLQQPHHNHHRHHHHCHPRNVHLAPTISPAPVPSLEKGAMPPEDDSPSAGKRAPAPAIQAKPPNCQFGYRKRPVEKARKPSLPPTVAPNSAPSPQLHIVSPAPVFHPVPASSPLPNVVYAHASPPSSREPIAEPSEMHAVAPSPSASSAGKSPTIKCAFSLLFILVLNL